MCMELCISPKTANDIVVFEHSPRFGKVRHFVAMYRVELTKMGDAGLYWAVLCVVCSVCSFFFGKFHERKLIETVVQKPKAYSRVPAEDDEQPLRESGDSSSRDLEYLQDQLDRERDHTRKIEAHYENEVKRLNNQIRKLASTQSRQHEQHKEQQATHELLSELSSELAEGITLSVVQGSDYHDLGSEIDRELNLDV